MDVQILCKPYSFCNQNCFYCFDKNNQKEKKLIDKNKVIRFFDKITDEFDKIDWVWHGGEITQCDINWFDDLMKELFFIAQKKWSDVTFSVQTNGTGNLQWYMLFFKYGFQLNLSYDFCESRGYYLNKKQINKHDGIIIVLNKYNLDKLKDIYEYNKINNIGISFNLPYGKNNLTQEDILGCSIEKCVDYIEDFIFNYYLYDKTNYNYVSERLTEILINLALGNKDNTTCSFNGCLRSNILVLTSDNKIRKCDNCDYDELIVYNDIDEYKSWNEIPVQNFNNLLKNKHNYKNECNNCKYNEICERGCLLSFLHNKENELNCLLIKRIVPKLYEILNDLKPEDFYNLNPSVKELLIKSLYIPSSILKEGDN